MDATMDAARRLHELTLSALFKSALTLEVETNMVRKIMQAGAVDRWHRTVLQIMHGAAVPSLIEVRRLIQEGEANTSEPGLAASPLMHELKRRRANTDAWVAEAKGALNPRPGSLLTAPEIAALIERGDDRLLGARSEAVAPLVEQLRRRKDHAYCLCSTPHDGSRPLFACNTCEEYYHPVCIAMDASAMGGPGGYRCPVCCWKRHEAYPNWQKMTPDYAVRVVHIMQGPVAAQLYSTQIQAAIRQSQAQKAAAAAAALAQKAMAAGPVGGLPVVGAGPLTAAPGMLMGAPGPGPGGLPSAGPGVPPMVGMAMAAGPGAVVSVQAPAPAPAPTQKGKRR